MLRAMIRYAIRHIVIAAPMFSIRHARLMARRARSARKDVTPCEEARLRSAYAIATPWPFLRLRCH